MRHHIIAIAIGFTIALGACTASPSVPTPSMPDDWEITEDALAGTSAVEAFEQAFDADLVAVRNTTFEVDGVEVQVNTLLAEDESEAQMAYDAIAATKPAEFLLLDGTTVYEFVATDAALAAVAIGRAHLQQ